MSKPTTTDTATANATKSDPLKKLTKKAMQLLGCTARIAIWKLALLPFFKIAFSIANIKIG